MPKPKKPTSSRGKTLIAVVGEFQMGKSSLINCLGGRRDGEIAPIGDGEISQTDKCYDYELTNNIVLIDTPGINDTGERDKEAEGAIQRAQCVIFVSDNLKSTKELYANWVAKIEALNKPCLFVCNCKTRASNRKKSWSPDSDVNAEFCQEQESFITKNGFDIAMQIGSRLVLPVNVCWAQYALGMLDDEERIGDVQDMCQCAEDKSDVLALSNVKVLGDFVDNIRLELLSHFLRHKEKTLTRVAERFGEELRKRLSRKGTA